MIDYDWGEQLPTLASERLVLRSLVETDVPALKTKTRAFGKGSQETLIGIGSDDARDALDRRVEFKVVDC